MSALQLYHKSGALNLHCNPFSSSPFFLLVAAVTRRAAGTETRHRQTPSSSTGTLAPLSRTHTHAHCGIVAGCLCFYMCVFDVLSLLLNCCFLHRNCKPRLFVFLGFFFPPSEFSFYSHTPGVHFSCSAAAAA